MFTSVSSVFDVSSEDPSPSILLVFVLLSSVLAVVLLLLGLASMETSLA